MDNNIPSFIPGSTEISNQQSSFPPSQEKTKTGLSGSFQGVPIEKIEKYPPFPQDADMGDRTWRDVPSSLPNSHPDESGLRAFISEYNRADKIAKRKNNYEAELRLLEIENPSPQKEGRIFILQKLIPLLEKARVYQNEMVNHLIKSESPDPRMKRLQLPFLLKSSLQINESLNKIECIAEQLEQDHLQLMDLQMQFEVIENYLAMISPTGEISPELEEGRRLIKEAKEHQRNLIEQKVAYAEALRPPYEQIDPQTQTIIEEIVLNCRKEQNFSFKKEKEALNCLLTNRAVTQEYYHQRTLQASQAAEKEAQKPQPRKQVINFYTQAADRWKQTAAAFIASKLEEGAYLHNSAAVVNQAAREAQQLQPRKQVIDFYIQAEHCWKQAAAAQTAGNSKIAACLHNSAADLNQAAREAQQLQARKQAIELFAQSADCYKQAAAAREEAFDLKRGAWNGALSWNFYTLGKQIDQMVLYLNDAALFFCKAAKEAQELQPRKQVIELFTQVADRFNQAATTSPTSDPTKAFNLSHSALALYEVVKEAQQSEPREQVIELFTKSADRFNEAATACGEGYFKKARYLCNSANALSEAAILIQQNQPEQAIEIQLNKAAEEYERASNSFSCTIS